MALNTWKSAYQHVLNGSANAMALCIGDSLTAGCASTGNQMGGNARSQSWPTQLAGLMTTAPASSASWMGDANCIGDGKTLMQYDYRITQGAGWTESTNNTTIGHYAQWQTGDVPTALSFAPGVSFDRIHIFYATYSGSPEYPVNIGGATLATLDMDRTNDDGVRSEIVSCTAGVNTVNIIGTVPFGSIGGCIVWSSATKQVNIVNAGWWGARAADYASNANTYQPIAAIKALAPRLTVLMLGGNDCLNGTSQSSLNASLTTIIDAAKLSGDVLMVGFTPVNPTIVSESVQDTYIGYLSSLASAKGLDFINLKSRPNWASYAAAVSAGYKDADGVHNTAAGNADIAAAILAAIDVQAQPDVSSKGGFGSAVFGAGFPGLRIRQAAAGGTLAAQASGAAQTAGTAQLSAAVAIVANGAASSAGGATLGAAVPLDAAGVAVASGSAAGQLTLNIAAAGLAQAAGSAGISAAVQLAAAGAAAAAGNAALAQQVALSAAGAATATGNAALAAQCAAVASGAAQAAGNATLLAAVALKASGYATAAGAATLSGGGVNAIAAGGSAQAGGSAVLSLLVTISASGGAQVSGGAQATAQGHGEADGAAQSGGAATIQARVDLSAAGFCAAMGSGVLQVAVPLSADGVAQASGGALLAEVVALVSMDRFALSASRRGFAVRERVPEMPSWSGRRFGAAGTKRNFEVSK